MLLETSEVFLRQATGELAVLGLAQILPAPLVLLNDEVARMEARRLGLPVRGSLGVLVQACRQQRLRRPQVALLLEEIGLKPRYLDFGQIVPAGVGGNDRAFRIGHTRQVQVHKKASKPGASGGVCEKLVGHPLDQGSGTAG